VQVERKLAEEEEGSGDGPLSKEVEENGEWAKEAKKDNSKSIEESVEFTHDFRDFHLGY